MSRRAASSGFTSQVSIRPPRFSVGLSKRDRTYRVAEGARHLTVHLIERRHCELARVFGGETGDDVDKFEQLVTFSDVRDLDPGHEA
jgi:flavin reductase (DIM6/NTAB) family NADH-FMN oxidoreductase RutF